jgi:ATP phosphoribosyltransferase
LRIAIPNKGRLNQSSIRLMNRIGFPLPDSSNRTLLAEFSKGRYQVLLARAQDIPEFVEMGAADMGITGLDRPEDIKDGSTVATSFPRLTMAYFSKLGKSMKLAEVTGAAEVATQVGLADVITDLTETGSTLKLNHLREVGVILESSAVLIGNRKLMAEKKDKVEEVTGAISSVINASKKRYLMANVPKASLASLNTLLPGVSGPTVMNIMGREDFVAIHAVTNEDEINGVITMLKSIGATGILVVPIERMVF